MPIVDLNTPTQVLLEWGWLLITRANGVVYALIVVVFLLGALVTLPGGKAQVPVQAVEVGAADAPEGGERA
jgi:hypothetical protein